LLQGLSASAAGFLQAVTLILYYVKLFILGSTPRSVYTIKHSLRNVQWGTLFPATTLVVVITLAYSIISPIINGLAVATFFLFYELWKYLFLYQLEQPEYADTGGLFFPKAIQHVFVGLYIQQICLAALFFLAQNEHHKPGAIPEGALMIVLILVTAFFHMVLNNSYGPLLHALPLSLADKSYGMNNHNGEEAAVVGENRDQGFGGDKVIGGDNKVTSSNLQARKRNPRDSDPELDQQQAPVTGRQPVAGNHDMRKSVPEEGKHNDDPTDFYHPAAVEPMRIIWIPQDPLGFAQGEEAGMRESGIESSTQHAIMTQKGTVEIDGPPPASDPILRSPV